MLLLFVVMGAGGCQRDPGAECVGQWAQQGGNALRADCTAGEVRYWRADRPEEVWATDPGTTGSTMAVMVADTEYHYTLDDGGQTVEGTLRTGSLPPALERLTIDVRIRDGARLDYLLVDAACAAGGDGELGYLVLLDAAGDIVWYERVPDATGQPARKVNGYDLMHDEPVVITDYDTVTRVGWDGSLEPILSFDGCDGDGEAAGPCAHHEILPAGDDLWTLTSTVEDHDEPPCSPDNDRFVLDAVSRIGPDGDVTSHTLDDLGLHPAEDPGPFPACGSAAYYDGVFPAVDDLLPWDHAHVNGVLPWPDPLGDTVLLSLRAWDAIVAADLSSDTVLWTLEGLGADTGRGDLLWQLAPGLEADPFGFETVSGQHHLLALEDGRLQAFDNQVRSDSPARIIRFTVDSDAGVATIDEVLGVTDYDGNGLRCTHMGSAYPLGGVDHVVAVCAAEGVIAELVAGDLPAWEARISCQEGTLYGLYRAVPVDRPGATLWTGEEGAARASGR